MVHRTRTEIGKALPNGAKLLLRQAVRDYEVVLAQIDNEGDRPIWATWRVFHKNDETTSDGCYFHSDTRMDTRALAQALENFQERCSSRTQAQAAGQASIAITLEIPREHINNALASAAASRTYGAGYWADFKEGRNGALLAREREDAANGGRVGAWYGLEAGLDKGLATMARIAPEAFGRLLVGDIDAPLGDVLVQCIVCGELRYG